MLNIGVGELLIILAICLILFGAKRLPALAKSLGESLKVFQDSRRTDKPNNPIPKEEANE